MAPSLHADPTPRAWGPAEDGALRRDLRAGAEAPSWDLVVVGAGITGAGVARDAVLRGLSVLVLDKEDVAFGTSSRSSRLIHGGVRYLEQLEFGLVFEALRERDRLVRNAAHLVRPARFVFPSYRGDRLGPWMLRAGLTVYDALRLFRGKGHRYLRPRRAFELEPLLGRDGLRGAVWYEDAVTDDARLTLATLQDARRHGAEVLTYAGVDAIAQGADGHLHIGLSDGIGIRARSVVVATGPWTGARLLGDRGRGLLSLSKGVHVVVPGVDVPVRNPVVVQVPGQRRILFAVPWGSRTYLGTTDSVFSGDPGESQVQADEEREVFGLVHRVLPNARLELDRVISAWSGVRPLVRPAGAEGEDTVELSRSHRIVPGKPGVFGIVGGKLTTYRAMAEEVVDEVVDWVRSRAPERRFEPCATARAPLVPGVPIGADERRDPLIADLELRHGPRARGLVRLAEALEDGQLPLAPELPYRRVEVIEAIEREGAVHLVDVLRRRLPLALTDPRLGGGVARWIAEQLVDRRGGSEADVRDELERYEHAVIQETRRRPVFD
jgi:glycerol-3-phosphate dehydrogenase